MIHQVGGTTIYEGDVLDGLAQMEPGSVACCVTSPPYYGLRDYQTGRWEGGDSTCDHTDAKIPTGNTQGKSSTLRNGRGVKPGEKYSEGSQYGYARQCSKCGARRIDKQIGLEDTPRGYVERLVGVFDAVWRVLRDDGTVWLNLGSSYASGDKQPNQSRADVLACGNDDRESQGFPDSDRVCPCCGGGLQVGSLSHHPHTVGTSQPTSPTERPPLQKARGNGRRASASTSLSVFLPSSPASTNDASAKRVRGASSLSDKAWVPPSIERSSLHGSPASVHKGACTSGTGSSDYLSGAHTLGMGVFCKACGYCTTTPLLFKPKDMIPIPWMVAMALQQRGWTLRQDIIWSKRNPMPESVKDRCTKSHEYIFLLSKSEKYYYDAESIREVGTGVQGGKGIGPQSGRKKGAGLAEMGVQSRKFKPGESYHESGNKRSVWTVSLALYKEAHFATFPPKLITPCILAGSPPGGLVLDPFMGSGTTAEVALSLGRKAVGCELNPEYVKMILRRVRKIEGQPTLLGRAAFRPATKTQQKALLPADTFKSTTTDDSKAKDDEA